MESNITERDGRYVCAVQGDIDMYSAPDLHRTWLAHAEKKQAKGFIIDMQKATYLDSSGIGVLVQILADAKQRDIPFCLCGVHGMIEKLLKLGRMNAILPVEKDLASAMARTGDAKK